MLDAKELRIGNAVLRGWSESIRTVAAITKTSVYLDEAIAATLYEDLRSIKLTPGILCMCGFSPIGSSQDFRRKNIILHTRKRGYVLKKSVPPIITLHQLQNLFHALTGEDLVITPAP